MTKAEIWDLIVSKTDSRDRIRLRLLEHSSPEHWIIRLLAATINHLDAFPEDADRHATIGATYARARR